MNGSLPTIESAIDKNQYFINKVNKIHNFKYDYPFLNYITAHKKVIITCREHGNFNQTPRDHIFNRGCPKCGDKRCSIHHSNDPTGWTKTNWLRNSITSPLFDSFKVYIIKCWNEEETFYKIGRTFRKIKNRFYGKSSLPYNFEIIKVIEGEAEEMYNTEVYLKNVNKEARYTPRLKFKGDRECFKTIKNL